jgi:hypothetical protein
MGETRRERSSAAAAGKRLLRIALSEICHIGWLSIGSWQSNDMDSPYGVTTQNDREYYGPF